MTIKRMLLAAFLTLAAAMAETLPASSLYGNLGLGEAYLSNSDVSGFDPSFDLCGDLSVGYKFNGAFGVEAGWGFGPMRSFEGLGGKLTLSTNQFFARPIYRFDAGQGFFGSEGAFLGLGLKVGMAMMSGELTSSWGPSANLDSTAPVIGLAARYELLLWRHVSLGLELSYDYCKFDTVKSGGQTTNDNFDFSGPSLKFIAAGWLSQPKASKADTGLTQDLAPAPGASAGKEAQRQGDAMLKAKRYRDAVLAYSKAVQLSPKNAGAWQALGNSYYYIGKKDYALSSYKTSLKLQGGKNPQLEAFIKSLEAH